MLDDPTVKVRDAVLSSGKGRLLRTEKWAYLDYGKTGELYNMEKDPKQYTSLAKDPAHQKIVARFKVQMANKLREVRNNDLK